MKALLAVSVALMLLGAAMLVADIGASGVWIAIITLGIALVLIGRNGSRPIHR